MIELKNVSIGYGKKNILNDISLSVEKGKFTSVIGVNGCGKSTLLKAILGIQPLNVGNITIDNASIKNLSRKEIAQKVAYLSQSKKTPNMTVEQMVLHGRFPHLNYPRHYKTKDYEIAFSAMQQVKITEYAHRPLHTLSGGMIQNAYIAMVLAQDTDYIILDEPTTYLDISHQIELMKTLRKLTEIGKGIIIVMHDLPLAMTFSDKIILLNEGTIVANEEPKTLCEKKIINAVFGVGIEYSQDYNSYIYKY